ncbi:glycoside hydrolase family 64 protein [Xylariaceae sp. AK1471]|nr:glycoside hydrolase family 64 protein [Xylariaceae sp. AK1471]
MHGLFGLAVASVAAFITGSLARPLVVHPGGVEDIVITEHNTINSTSTKQAAQGNNPLQLEIVNNFGSNQMYLYVTGSDSNGVACMLGADGNFFYPDAGGSGVPIPITGNVATALGGMGSTTTVTLPDSLISSRIWVSEGQLQFYTVISGTGASAIVEPSVSNPDDPSANIKWGFVEFNWEKGAIFANISFVDWVGIAMGMGLTLASGETQIVRGLVPGAVENICTDLKAQNSKDGAGWDKLCMTNSNGEVLRVLSSNLFIASNPTWQSDYYNSYIDQVWDKYTNEDLTIATQSDAGDVACRVSGNQMTCNGDNRGYPKPTIADIYGCNSGPFTVIDGDNGVHKAIVPRLCAAFGRSTLLLDGGNVQPSLSSASYYTVDPTNHYARVVHNYEQDGLGYAFSYDDVNPSGENAAGTVAGSSPTVLKVTAGGWS